MKQRGFTLIELVIVMTLMGLILAIAYPQYQVLSHSNLRESSLQLAGSIRYLYTRAILDKKPWRLAVDFKNNKYWGERLTEQTETEKKPEEKSLTGVTLGLQSRFTEDPNKYSLDGSTGNVAENSTTYVKVLTPVLKVTRLPKGVIFRDMRVVGRDLQNSEIGYIYFSPYGGVERSVIHLKHEDRAWVFTLVTKPLSGRVAVFDEDKDIERAPIFGRVRE